MADRVLGLNICSIDPFTKYSLNYTGLTGHSKRVCGPFSHRLGSFTRSKSSGAIPKCIHKDS